MIRVTGSGASALIVSACLEYLHKDFYIDTDRELKTPEIMWLRYNNEDEKELYTQILQITNDVQYTKHVKIGYLYKDKIYDNATHEMKYSYLRKQNRVYAISSMSDGKSEFDVFELNKILPKLKEKYQRKIEQRADYNFTYDTIDELHKINKEPSYEYISTNTILNLGEYDIIYDCDDPFIKRYTPTQIEYIWPPAKEHTVITNYYDEPKIYLSQSRVIIGRYATKTQLKQKDIIDYMLYGRGIIENV